MKSHSNSNSISHSHSSPPLLSPSNSISSINSNSGDYGRTLVKNSLTRPHPTGAVISKREQVRKGKWSKGDKIGSGSFGTVFMGMNTSSGSMMAVKVSERAFMLT